MLHKSRVCADMGTENCPCRLAEYGKCLVCGRLDSEKGTCDCVWQGVCIYNEYMQNNCCINGWQRDFRPYKIQKIKRYEKDLVVLQISVPRGVAEKAALPGSFVFVKAENSPQFFDVPLSVMKSDYEKGCIELALKVDGPKTCELISRISDRLLMRGIYRNGLRGVGKLMSPEGKRVLCLTKGIGLAPVANYIRWAGGKDRIDVIADLEKISLPFAEAALDGCQIESVTYDRLPMEMSWAAEERYDVIVISASDYFQENIFVPESKKVLSNNHTMCCGEGICGSCMCGDRGGVRPRMCKRSDL